MTQSLEDYLETIYVLIRDKHQARVRDIAHALKVKMPSVVKGVSELKKHALVTQEPYGDIALTPKGRRLAAMVLNRHVKIKEFLVRIGVTPLVAERDACRMEHILSANAMDKITSFVRKAEQAEKDAAEKAAKAAAEKAAAEKEAAK